MSLLNLCMNYLFKGYGWIFLALFIISSLLTIFGCPFRNRYFAFFMYIFTKLESKRFKNLKDNLFKSLPSLKSAFPAYRRENRIKLLEVGVGTGTNFKYYPDGTHLIAVDYNGSFKSYFDANRNKFPSIKSDEIVVAKGENLEVIPDASVDVVVMTLVLCSVTHVEKVVREAFRVLAPGGKFYFLEHVRDWDRTHFIRCFLQDMLTWARIWPVLADGCELNREPDKVIREVFKDVDLEHVYTSSRIPIFKVIDSNLVGVATKSSQ